MSATIEIILKPKTHTKESFEGMSHAMISLHSMRLQAHIERLEQLLAEYHLCAINCDTPLSWSAVDYYLKQYGMIDE